MERPHFCQRCPAIFVLASSLRAHTAHIHGEELQAFPTESGFHPSVSYCNHGDTTVAVQPDEIKRELCGTDCEASAFLVTDSRAVDVGFSDGHCKCVDFSLSGNHGDIKPDRVKAEIQVHDYGVDSAQVDTLVTDKRAHVVSGLCGKSDDRNSSATHVDTAGAGEVKPDMVKIQVCDHEVDSVQYNAVVTDKQAYAIANANIQLNLHSPKADAHEKGALPHDSIQIYTCEKNKETANTCLESNRHGNPYAHDDCKKSYNQVCNLKTHQHTQTGDKSYTCDLCDQRFDCLPQFKTHERMDTGEQNDTVCMKSYNQSSTLKTNKPIHTGESPRGSNVRKNNFNSLSTVERHEPILTSIKLFACNVCEKSFSYVSDLKRHELIHTGDQPYACNVCEKNFAHNYTLYKHKRIHTGENPYECNICGACFKQWSTLKRHERIHTGDKPYACNVCKKSFNSRTGIKRHERIHTGDKPFACNVCEKRFTQLGNSKRHERIHKHTK